MSMTKKLSKKTQFVWKLSFAAAGIAALSPAPSLSTHTMNFNNGRTPSSQATRVVSAAKVLETEMRQIDYFLSRADEWLEVHNESKVCHSLSAAQGVVESSGTLFLEANEKNSLSLVQKYRAEVSNLYQAYCSDSPEDQFQASIYHQKKTALLLAKTQLEAALPTLDLSAFKLTHFEIAARSINHIHQNLVHADSIPYPTQDVSTATCDYLYKAKGSFDFWMNLSQIDEIEPLPSELAVPLIQEYVRTTDDIPNFCENKRNIETINRRFSIRLESIGRLRMMFLGL